MFTRGISALFVASVVLFATSAEAASTTPHVKRLACRAALSDKAVDKALLINGTVREELRSGFEAEVAKIGVYVPVGTVNKVRSLLVENEKVTARFTMLKGEAYTDKLLAEAGRVEAQISKLLVAVMQHPRNAQIFDLSKATILDVSGTDLTRYVEWAPNLDLGARLAYLTVYSAYIGSAVRHTDSSYRLNMDAGTAFSNYHRANQAQKNLEFIRNKTDLGQLTIAELEARHAKLLVEYRAINDRYVDNPVLPESLTKAIEEMLEQKFEKNTHLSDILTGNRAIVDKVEEQLNAGKSSDQQWSLSALWFEGASVVSVVDALGKDHVREGLRRIVISKNKDRLMPADVYTQLDKVDSELKKINRVTSAIRKEGAL